MTLGFDVPMGVRTLVRAPSAFLPRRVFVHIGLLAAFVVCVGLATPAHSTAAGHGVSITTADSIPSQPFPPAGYDSLRTPAPAETDLPRATLDTLAAKAPGTPPAQPRDTTRVLPFGAQLWGEGGFGGMVGPDDVRKYFQVGLGGDLTFRAEGRPWFTTLLRLGLQSVPRADQFQIVTDRGVETVTLGGNALQARIVAGPGVKVWRRLWLETGVGVAHLHVGSGNEALGSLVDAAAITAIRNTTGLATEAQLAWRFPITDTQSMSLTLGWQGNRAGETDRWINYVPFRIGYRFL